LEKLEEAMQVDDKETNGPVAGRAAGVVPRAKNQDERTDPLGKPSPGAAEDEAQAKERPD
jgi:hypothetical protein